MTSPRSSGVTAESRAISSPTPKDHVAGPVLLHLFAVEQAAQFEVVGVVQFVRGHERRADAAEAGVGLGEAEVWCWSEALQVAFGEVLADGYAHDVVPAVVGRDPVGAATEHHDQLDFPVDRARRQHDFAGGSGH
jgi:hypothetical protein